MLEVLLIGVSALVSVTLLTGLVRSIELRRGRLDVPNERSSHVVPVPRGGGLAIALVSIAAVAAGAARGTIELDLALALCASGLIVAGIGFVDDRDSLPAGVRLVAHVIAAGMAVVVLGGLPPVQVGSRIVDLGVAGDVIAVVGIVWSINLFNFMDGIDGIAGSQSFFVALAGAVLAWAGVAASGFAVASVIIAGASLGFLIWNWQPARIFMGDVGSGYLGLVLGVLAVAYAREHPGGLFVWLILGAAFLADATVTVARRLLRREHLFQAHRMHAYQWLSRRWKSHQAVTIAFLALNFLGLLPLAWYANTYPATAAGIALGAVTLMMVLAGILGSGRREISHQSRVD